MTTERGAGSALAASILLLATVAAAVATGFGVGVAALHRARSAADLAALAGAAGIAGGRPGCAAAAPIAVANGGALVECRERDDGIDVVVAVALSGGGRLLPSDVRAAASAGVE